MQLLAADDNSYDRRLTGKALVQKLHQLSCITCTRLDGMRRGRGLYGCGGGGVVVVVGAHLFKQPELSRGNENFHPYIAVQILFTSFRPHSRSPVAPAAPAGSHAPSRPRDKSLRLFAWKVQVLNVSVFCRALLKKNKKNSMACKQSLSGSQLSAPAAPRPPSQPPRRTNVNCD